MKDQYELKKGFKFIYRIIRSLDELSVFGIITLVAWALIASAWLQRHGPTQLLWLCDIGIFLTGIGLIIKSRLILTAQFVGLFIYHLCWHIDFLSFVLFKEMLFSSTAYMFSDKVTVYEKSLSFFHHTYTIPVLLWALLRLGTSKSGWIFQTIQTSVAFILTYFLTDPLRNVNWIFGAGFADISPAKMNPVVYYITMIIFPPIIIYWPLNILISRFISRIEIRSKIRIPIFSSFVFAIVFSLIIIVISRKIGMECDINVNFPKSILELHQTNLSDLEDLQTTTNAPIVVSVAYGAPGQEQDVLLRALEDKLPRVTYFNGRMGNISLQEILKVIPIKGIPCVPQQIVVRGKRGQKGTIIYAVVASDKFYLQSYCDKNTALEHFEVHCQLGEEGLGEFIDMETGKYRVGIENRVVFPGGFGSLYAVTIVAISDQMPVARSAFYIFNRTGVSKPYDIFGSQNQQN